MVSVQLKLETLFEHFHTMCIVAPLRRRQAATLCVCELLSPVTVNCGRAREIFRRLLKEVCAAVSSEAVLCNWKFMTTGSQAI